MQYPQRQVFDFRPHLFLEETIGGHREANKVHLQKPLPSPIGGIRAHTPVKEVQTA